MSLHALLRYVSAGIGLSDASPRVRVLSRPLFGPPPTTSMPPHSHRWQAVDGSTRYEEALGEETVVQSCECGMARRVAMSA